MLPVLGKINCNTTQHDGKTGRVIGNTCDIVILVDSMWLVGPRASRALRIRPAGGVCLWEEPKFTSTRAPRPFRSVVTEARSVMLRWWTSPRRRNNAGLSVLFSKRALWILNGLTSLFFWSKVFPMTVKTWAFFWYYSRCSSWTVRSFFLPARCSSVFSLRHLRTERFETRVHSSHVYQVTFGRYSVRLE